MWPLLPAAVGSVGEDVLSQVQVDTGRRFVGFKFDRSAEDDVRIARCGKLSVGHIRIFAQVLPGLHNVEPGVQPGAQVADGSGWHVLKFQVYLRCRAWARVIRTLAEQDI